jgi:glycogen debranching enzyme
MNTEALRGAIRTALLSNFKEGFSKLLGKQYCYIQPSPTTYPFEFFWDTCVHLIMLSRLGEYDWARRNLESMLSMQDESGFLGHMIYWHQALPNRLSDILQSKPTFRSLRPHMSALIQPTFLAQVLERLYEGTEDIQILKQFLPAIIRYHAWLKKNRDFDGNGLITIISPFESGVDHKPSYDQVYGLSPAVAGQKLLLSSLYWRTVRVDASNFFHRYDVRAIRKHGPFLVRDVLVNTIYALDLLALSRLCRAAGDAEAAKMYEKDSAHTTQSMIDIMYDPEDNSFWDVYGKDNIKSKVLTPTILYPIALPQVSDDIAKAMIERHLIQADYFNTEFPIPSVAKSENSFSPLESPFIWRGPVWVIHNWFLSRALTMRGQTDLAQKLKMSLKGLIETSGFREYYDPFTGKGYGAPNFTWPGLILDM